jgi:hypothetical protein
MDTTDEKVRAGAHLKRPVALNEIEDPETGLALLAEAPAPQTPEQERTRLFWTEQFKQWRQWRAGDKLAFCRALVACQKCHKPPPRWLCDASLIAVQGMTRAELREQAALSDHIRRWQAVQAARGLRPWDGRNNPKPGTWEDAWAEAADRLGESDRTVRESYTLVQAAGGADITLETYRREVRRRKL